jgi:hypothetical protein
MKDIKEIYVTTTVNRTPLVCLYCRFYCCDNTTGCMKLGSHVLYNFPLLFFLCLFFLMEYKEERTKIMFPGKTTKLFPSQEPRSKWKLQATTKWN